MNNKEKLNNNPQRYKFISTNDGSVGLYNYVVDDIYHSIYGAREEAEDKFVRPLEFKQNFFNKDNLKILDICYGIGYNSKALLKKFIQTKYTGKVSLDIVEIDKELVMLSPFIKDGYFKLYPEISCLLLKSFIQELVSNESLYNDLHRVLTSDDNKKYIEPFYRPLIKKIKEKGYINTPRGIIKSFLHNIYYHCISQRNKKPHKRLKLNNFSIHTYFEDARLVVQSLSNQYDIIFLDAFTPSKLPTLWSLEFFRELYRLASDNCMLLTYSNSVSVRHAMIESGFTVGKLFDKNGRHCGTAASKNPDLIKNKLDEYDLGLIKTNAGVYYRDKNLNQTPEEILEEHKTRKLSSNLESSSHYIKRYKKELEHHA